MKSAGASSETLRASRPYRAIADAIGARRLAHAVILSGDNPEALETAAMEFAAMLLGQSPPMQDCFHLRPANKMRQIRVEDARSLIQSIQHTASGNNGKVVIIHHADRMNTNTANALLKTIEEPPPETRLLLYSTRASELLPTIRSRCLLFRLPTPPLPINDPQWQSWLEDYTRWVQQLRDKPHPLAALFLYGLLTRFTHILGKLGAEATADLDQENMPEEQLNALEVSAQRALRTRLLADIEERTLDMSREALDPHLARILPEVLEALEKAASLLEVNLAEAAALEFFLLRSLRLWSQARRPASA